VKAVVVDIVVVLMLMLMLMLMLLVMMIVVFSIGGNKAVWRRRLGHDLF